MEPEKIEKSRKTTELRYSKFHDSLGSKIWIPFRISKMQTIYIQGQNYGHRSKFIVFNCFSFFFVLTNLEHPVRIL